MRQFGDDWWIATVLIIAPRWPFALPLVALWPYAVFKRNWHSVAVVTAAAGIVLVPILGFRVSLPRSQPERGAVRLLTCNVHRRNVDTGEFAKFIAETGPDVVACQDWTQANYDTLFGGGGWHVHREGELFVASRFPIVGVKPIQLWPQSESARGEQGSAALFELQTPKGSVFLLNLHLASPHAGLIGFAKDSGDRLTGNVERRWCESDVVRDAADAVKGPLLMAGDFNTTDDSPIFRQHWGDFDDAFSECGLGFGYTYLINHTQLRIDHVLAGPSLKFIRCWVGPMVGSPHRPLVADVDYR
jgi:endonuclease/exonuclease/phosphatase (EEP) superfamily protein YafD